MEKEKSIKKEMDEKRKKFLFIIILYTLNLVLYVNHIALKLEEKKRDEPSSFLVTKSCPALL